MRAACALLFVGSLLSAPLGAVGTSGADILRLKLDARAWALGMGGTPLLTAGNSVVYNPASLGACTRPTFGFLHHFAFPDVSCEQLAFRRPVRSFGALGGELLHRHQEPIDNVKGEAPLAVSDTVLALSFGRSHEQDIYYGLSLKGVILKLGDDYAYGFAADLGVIYCLERYFDHIGLAVRNVGPGVKFRRVADPLPLEGSCGLARSFSLRDGWGIVRGVADLDLGREGEVGLSLGAEVGQERAWMLRAGYRLERGNAFADGPGVGLGLTKDFGAFQMQLDYCCKFIFFELGGGDYEPEHLLGFTMLIGKREEVARPAAVEGAETDGKLVEEGEEAAPVDGR